jgi:hypothetical protein
VSLVTISCHIQSAKRNTSVRTLAHAAITARRGALTLMPAMSITRLTARRL